MASAPVAILGTINPDGSVHLVPITFALVGETLYSAVDHKPKSTRSLKRLDNVRRDPRVTLLVEHHEEDWSALWWCRLDGNAIVSKSRDAEGLSALTSKYPDYVKRPPDGPWLRVQIEAATGWAATA